MLQDSSPNPSAVHRAAVKVYTSTPAWREPTVPLTWKLRCQVFSPPSEPAPPGGRVAQAETKRVQTWRLKEKKKKKKGIPRAILHPKRQGAKHGNSRFVEPAELPLPATGVTLSSS